LVELSGESRDHLNFKSAIALPIVNTARIHCLANNTSGRAVDRWRESYFTE